ncbi:MAG: hypothetical protein HOP30_13880 [Cyclobacteriaceae bacterium]|nr:hypothetical protein [Cyclobacteriaceae bacterium]
MNFRITTNQLWVFLLALLMACSSKDTPQSSQGFDCTKSTLLLQAATTTNPTTCSGSDGSITPNATGGETPYQYAIGGGAYSSVLGFTGLSAGKYTIKVKDKNGCEKTQEVTLASPNSTVAITSIDKTISGCGTSTGSITVNATGTGLTYRKNTEAFVSTSTFSNLAPGSYQVTVKDASNCTTTQTVQVLSSIKFSDVQAIVNTNCAVSGCHVSGGTAPFALTTESAIKSRATSIKSATQSKSMPKGGSLSQSDINAIACWVDDGAN